MLNKINIPTKNYGDIKSINFSSPYDKKMKILAFWTE